MAAPIPKDVLKAMLADDFMQQCCLCGSEHKQFHHNFEYARKALNEAWCILPLCPEHHEMVRNINVRRLLDWAMLNRATDADLKRYSRVMDYKARRDWLSVMFGEFSPRTLRSHFEQGRHLGKANVGAPPKHSHL